MRMTTTHRVPLQPTLVITGDSEIQLREGVTETVKWLRAADPAVYAGSAERGVTQ